MSSTHISSEFMVYFVDWGHTLCIVYRRDVLLTSLRIWHLLDSTLFKTFAYIIHSRSYQRKPRYKHYIKLLSLCVNTSLCKYWQMVIQVIILVIYQYIEWINNNSKMIDGFKNIRQLLIGVYNVFSGMKMLTGYQLTVLHIVSLIPECLLLFKWK